MAASASSQTYRRARKTQTLGDANEVWPRSALRRRSGDTTSKGHPVMLCYSCFEQGTERPAVALCRSCDAGLCLDHLRATAAHFATSHMLDSCHHDTWTATEHAPHADLLSRL
jgi:hypothetical protein